MDSLNLLFLGDIAAGPGRAALARHLPMLREKFNLHAVVANGENSAPNGKGITPETAQDIFKAGVDVITLGDHTFDQKDIETLLAGNPKVIRPSNYLPGTAGRGSVIHVLPNGKRLGVINLQGQAFLRQQILNPVLHSRELMETFILGETVDALVIDIHAEATAEKVIIGHIWDGKASLVVGTHTHIPTADTRILKGGTAYQTDAGMCGDYHSCIGMSFASIMPTHLTQGRHKFETATGEATLSGVLVTIGANGLAEKTERLLIGGVLTPTHG